MRDSMCSFFQQMAALRQLEGKDRMGEGGTNCGFFSPSSPLIFMTFAFYLPLTTAWGLKRGKTCFYLSQDSGLISYLPAL